MTVPIIHKKLMHGYLIFASTICLNNQKYGADAIMCQAASFRHRGRLIVIHRDGMELTLDMLWHIVVLRCIKISNLILIPVPSQNRT